MSTESYRLLCLTLFFLTSAASPAMAGHSDPDPAFETAEGLIHRLYEIVTFEAGTTPNWDEAREAFLPEGLVIMRMGEDSTAVLGVEGWIDDFVSFIDNHDVKSTGFSEKIIKTKTSEMGDIASVRVLYESHLPGYPARQGVDFFHVIRQDGRWWIVSILNELPRWGHEIPAELQP